VEVLVEQDDSRVVNNSVTLVGVSKEDQTLKADIFPEKDCPTINVVVGANSLMPFSVSPNTLPWAVVTFPT